MQQEWSDHVQLVGGPERKEEISASSGAWTATEILPWILSLVIYLADLKISGFPQYVSKLFKISPLSLSCSPLFLFPLSSLSLSWLPSPYLHCLSFYWFCLAGFPWAIHTILYYSLHGFGTMKEPVSQASGPRLIGIGRIHKRQVNFIKVPCFFCPPLNVISILSPVIVTSMKLMILLYSDSFALSAHMRSRPSLRSAVEETFWGPWKKALLWSLQSPKWLFLAAEV